MQHIGVTGTFPPTHRSLFDLSHIPTPLQPIGTDTLMHELYANCGYLAQRVWKEDIHWIKNWSCRNTAKRRLAHYHSTGLVSKLDASFKSNRNYILMATNLQQPSPNATVSLSHWTNEDVPLYINIRFDSPSVTIECDPCPDPFSVRASCVQRRIRPKD